MCFFSKSSFVRMYQFEPLGIKHKSLLQPAINDFSDYKIEGWWNWDEPDLTDAEVILNKALKIKNESLPGQVCASTFVIIDQGQLVGFSNLRHELNENLKIRGGHIGYHVRPNFWNKGYGSALLKNTLVEAKKIHLKRVLLTVNEVNPHSIRIIEKFGGELEKIKDVGGLQKRYYWIDLK